MTYPFTPSVRAPLATYRLADAFGKDSEFDGVNWGLHLGQDMNARAGALVHAIGRGVVLFVGYYPGTPKKKNWGHVVIIGHKHPARRTVFFSLYGHISDVRVKKGNTVTECDIIGCVGRRLSPDNGYWGTHHLHFAIYIGPWRGRVLPGYYREDQGLTLLKWWVDPMLFLATYAAADHLSLYA